MALEIQLIRNKPWLTERTQRYDTLQDILIFGLINYWKSLLKMSVMKSTVYPIKECNGIYKFLFLKSSDYIVNMKWLTSTKKRKRKYNMVQKLSLYLAVGLGRQEMF